MTFQTDYRHWLRFWSTGFLVMGFVLSILQLTLRAPLQKSWEEGVYDSPVTLAVTAFSAVQFMVWTGLAFVLILWAVQGASRWVLWSVAGAAGLILLAPYWLSRLMMTTQSEALLHALTPFSALLFDASFLLPSLALVVMCLRAYADTKLRAVFAMLFVAVVVLATLNVRIADIAGYWSFAVALVIAGLFLPSQRPKLSPVAQQWLFVTAAILALPVVLNVGPEFVAAMMQNDFSTRISMMADALAVRLPVTTLMTTNVALVASMLMLAGEFKTNRVVGWMAWPLLVLSILITVDGGYLLHRFTFSNVLFWVRWLPEAMIVYVLIVSVALHWLRPRAGSMGPQPVAA